MKRCMILGLALLLLAACVPTPDEPIVVGKDNEAMIEKATETEAAPRIGESLYDTLGAPHAFTFSYEDEAKKLRIEGEPQVVLPDTDGLPLAYVQAGRFDQELVYAFFRTLTAGQEMFDIPTETPKRVIEQQIKAQQAALEDLYAQGKDDTDSEVRSRLDSIQSMQQNYQNAPEEVTLVPNDGTLKSYEMNFMGKARGVASGVHAVSSPFEENQTSFSVNNDAEYADSGTYTFIDEDGNEQVFNPSSGSNLFYVRESHDLIGTYASGSILLDVTKESETDGTLTLPDGLTVQGHLSPETLLLSITPAQARRQAETLLKDCGVEDMVLDGVYLMTNREILYPDWYDAEYLEQQRTKSEHQVYVIRFLRSVAGVPVESYYGFSQITVDDSGYGPEWSYETLEIAVDDEGIQGVHWEGPLTVESIVTDHAALLPFSEIKDISEKMLPVIYANYGAESGYTIEITNVRLCLWRIFDKNSFTRGILAPVWCFYGTQNGYSGRGFHPILILNAVDGTVIDPLQGY